MCPTPKTNIIKHNCKAMHFFILKAYGSYGRNREESKLVFKGKLQNNFSLKNDVDFLRLKKGRVFQFNKIVC
jgi:hypothetical protein